jgi:ATP-dependent DNA helicase RecG
MPRTFSDSSDLVETGIIEQGLDFVRRNIEIKAWIGTGGQREERWDYPLAAVREALVNAVAHRDYTIAVIDIELSLYSDRLEIISPGRLPKTVTVEKMRAGYRASRNELIK